MLKLFTSTTCSWQKSVPFCRRTTRKPCKHTVYFHSFSWSGRKLTLSTWNRALRRQISSHLDTAQYLLEAWKTISSRLQKEDNDNRPRREAAAFAALNKVTAPADSQSEENDEPTISPVTAQVYQTIAQLARVTRDLLAGLAEAKEVVL